MRFLFLANDNCSMTMDLEGWIWVAVLAIIAVVFALLFLVTKFLYFLGMDFSPVLTMQLKIPVGDIELNAKLLLPRYALNENEIPREPIPLVFFNPGWASTIDLIVMKQYAAAIALGGPYAVLMYDCRGFGKSPGKRKLDAKLFDDVIKVFDFGEKLDGIDPNRLGFIGISMGGEVALARAYPDKRIKAIVAMCTPHDAKENFTRKPESVGARVRLGFLSISGVKGKKIPDDTNQKISPRYVLEINNSALNDRVMIIHTKTDTVIYPGEFEKNRQTLGLGDDRAIILERGGHAFFHQELSVLASALRWFKEKL